jgi:amino acid permease
MGFRANWNAAPAALPVMVVAFTFHNIVPSLLSYLGSSERVMKVS